MKINTDKILFISIIAIVISIILPLLFVLFSLPFIYVADKIFSLLSSLSLILALILWAIVIPISYITLIIIFFMKLFKKSKSRKNYMLIFINISAIILFGYIILYAISIWHLLDRLF